MKLYKPQQLSLLTRTFENDGKVFLVVTMMAGFSPRRPNRLLHEASFWEGATKTLGTTVLDQAMSKQHAELLVGGSACAPGGKPTPGMPVGLVDENGREVPAGQEGEIALRVKPDRPLGLFQEYWLHPQETAAHFQGDWYLTGDRATRDADGYFWFVGRQDDVIKSSGYRIGPFEVESVLLEHPAVLEAAVIGKPDEARGQIVKAFVVLRAEANASEELTNELQHHCRQTAAPTLR